MPETTVTTPPAWHNGIDAGVTAAWTNKGYDLSDPVKTATAMWEQYKNLESHMGVPADRLLRLPKDAADEAGWKSVRTRLGVPNEAKDYDFAGVKFADGTDLEQGFTDTMRASLHKAGVAKDAAPEVVKAVIKYLDDAAAAEGTTKAQTLAEQKAALQKSWGPRHDENLLAAKQGARRLGVEPETVAALESLVGYDKVMEMFRKVGAGTNEDTFHVGRETGSPSTQVGAQARLTELQADKAWVNRLMSGDMTAKREFHALTEQIAGVTSAAA
jgi:hypothetical protein